MARRDDLDPVAVLEFGPERHQLVVDAHGHAAIANIGMHRVGEIDRGGAARHGHDLAFRREYVDLVGKQVHLDVLEKLRGVAEHILETTVEAAGDDAGELSLRQWRAQILANRQSSTISTRRSPASHLDMVRPGISLLGKYTTAFYLLALAPGLSGVRCPSSLMNSRT